MPLICNIRQDLYERTPILNYAKVRQRSLTSPSAAKPGGS
jgi:hypothetical protein